MNTQEFRNKAHQIVDDVTMKIEKLQQKQKADNGQSDQMYNEKLQQLKRQKEDLKLRYEKLKTASIENFEEMKLAFNKSASHFKSGFAELEKMIK
jgi:hypothetical protein